MHIGVNEVLDTQDTGKHINNEGKTTFTMRDGDFSTEGNTCTDRGKTYSTFK